MLRERSTAIDSYNDSPSPGRAVTMTDHRATTNDNLDNKLLLQRAGLRQGFYWLRGGGLTARVQ